MGGKVFLNRLEEFQFLALILCAVQMLHKGTRETSNSFLGFQCQIDSRDQILIFQVCNNLANLLLLWFFGCKQGIQRTANLTVVFTKRLLNGSFVLSLLQPVQASVQKVGQSRLQAQETRNIRIGTEQSPVDRFLQHLWPAFKRQS